MFVINSSWWCNSFSRSFRSAAWSPFYVFLSSIFFFILESSLLNFRTMSFSYSSFNFFVLGYIPSIFSCNWSFNALIIFKFFFQASFSYPNLTLNSLCKSSMCFLYSYSRLIYLSYLLNKSSCNFLFSSSYDSSYFDISP